MNIEKAKENTKNTDEYYIHKRLREMLKAIEDCTQSVRCMNDLLLTENINIHAKIDKKYISFYMEQLKRRGFEPYIYECDHHPHWVGRPYHSLAAYLKVKNTWRSSPTDS